MEQQSKLKFHITWNEAWRAEKAREKARQACCNEIPTAGPRGWNNTLKTKSDFSLWLPLFLISSMRLSFAANEL